MLNKRFISNTLLLNHSTLPLHLHSRSCLLLHTHTPSLLVFLRLESVVLRSCTMPLPLVRATLLVGIERPRFLFEVVPCSAHETEHIVFQLDRSVRTSHGIVLERVQLTDLPVVEKVPVLQRCSVAIQRRTQMVSARSAPVLCAATGQRLNGLTNVPYDPTAGSWLD